MSSTAGWSASSRWSRIKPLSASADPGDRRQGRVPALQRRTDEPRRRARALVRLSQRAAARVHGGLAGRAHALKPAPRVVWPTEPSANERRNRSSRKRPPRVVRSQHRRSAQAAARPDRDPERARSSTRSTAVRRVREGAPRRARLAPRHEGEARRASWRVTLRLRRRRSSPPERRAERPIAGHASQRALRTDEEATPSSRKRPAAR